MKIVSDDRSDFLDVKSNEAFLLSVKALILNGDRILILKYPKRGETRWNGSWNARWGLPGGLVEMDEAPDAGLKREIKEETGLQVELGSVFGVGEMKLKRFIFRDGRESKVRIIELGYKCSYVSGEAVISSEHSEFKWVTVAELKKLKFTPDSKDLIQSYISENNKKR